MCYSSLATTTTLYELCPLCSTAIHNMFAYHATTSDMVHATNQDVAIEGAAKQLSRSSPRGPSTAEDVLYSRLSPNARMPTIAVHFPL